MRESFKRGWVYMLGAEGVGLVKIGYTRNPPQRFKALRAESVTQLLVLYLVAGNPSDERALHRRFAALRERGEWFRLERGNPLDGFIRESREDFEMELHCDDFNEDGAWGAYAGAAE